MGAHQSVFCLTTILWVLTGVNRARGCWTISLPGPRLVLIHFYYSKALGLANNSKTCILILNDVLYMGCKRQVILVAHSTVSSYFYDALLLS